MAILRSTLIALAAALLLALPALAQDQIKIEDAYARVSGGKGGAASVYFLIRNTSDADLTILTASVDLAQIAGLHTHKESADGMMQMLEVEDGIPLDAGATHAFARGADHVMAMGLTKALADGDMITVTLTFDAADPVTFEALVDNERSLAPATPDQPSTGG
jgi:copper(I)-binding protein